MKPSLWQVLPHHPSTNNNSWWTAGGKHCGEKAIKVAPWNITPYTFIIYLEYWYYGNKDQSEEILSGNNVPY